MWLLLMTTLPESTERMRQTVKKAGDESMRRNGGGDGERQSKVYGESPISCHSVLPFNVKHKNNNGSFLLCLICITVTPSTVLFFHGTLGCVMKYEDTMLLLLDVSNSLAGLQRGLPSRPIFQCEYQSKLLIQDLGQHASDIKRVLI